MIFRSYSYSSKFLFLERHTHAGSVTQSMGKKNRNPGSGPKQSLAESSSSVTQSATAGAASVSTSADPSVSLSKIMSAYERALDAIKRGSHTEALKLMEELISQHNDPVELGMVHRFQSTIYEEVANVSNDPIAKERHRTKAIESAREAAEISPCSLVMAHFYAKLLFVSANNWDGYEQVVKECERALAILDPMDPAKQSWKYENQPELSTAEARIAHLQNKLRKLVHSSEWSVSLTVPLTVSSSKPNSRDFAHFYLKSMSMDFKEFLRIQVSDLNCHFASSEYIWPNPKYLLTEALSYAESNNKTWKYWLCCYCLTKKFPDPESLTQHVRNKFVGNLLPDMLGVLPENVEGDWVKKILSHTWQPLDASAALKLLEDTTEGIEIDWPLSDDSERAKLLEKIHEAFNTLIARESLAASHLKHVIKISIDEIQELAARFQPMNQRLDLSPTCICFLEAPQLKTIHRFLEEMCDACDDKGKSRTYDLPNISQNPEIKEKIFLNEDATCLVLDDCLVPAEIPPPGTNPFLSWIFSGSSCWDELDSSKKRKEHRRTQAAKLVHAIREEFNHLHSLSKMKCEEKSYEEALQIVEDLCVYDNNSTELDRQDYGRILKRRREELTKCDNDAVSVSNKFELEAIIDILKEARAMNANQSSEDDGEIIADIDIVKAIKKLKEDLSMEIGRADIKFMTSVKTIEQLELKLGPATACDFRETLIPIVKSYLRAHLGDLGKKMYNKLILSSEVGGQELDNLEELAENTDFKEELKMEEIIKQYNKRLVDKIQVDYTILHAFDDEAIEDTTATLGSSYVVKDDEEELRIRELEKGIREHLQKLQNTELEEEEKRKLDEELNQKLELKAQLEKAQLENEANEMQQGRQQV